MRRFNPMLVVSILLTAAVPLAAASCIRPTEKSAERTVAGTTSATTYQGQGPTITSGAFNICSSETVTYAVDDLGLAHTQQRARENWSWQVAHTPGLGPTYSDWSKAASSGMSCMPLQQTGNLPPYRCTATGTPCAG